MERVFCGCPACFGWRIFCAQVGAYFRVRLGPGGVVRVLCAASGFPVCYEVDSSPLFNFNRIFPPSPERAETLRRNLLFEGTMLMPSDLLGYAILCAGSRVYNT